MLVFHLNSSPPWEAKSEAAYEAVKAACEAQCPSHLSIDNLALQREVDKCLDLSRHWRHIFARWMDLAELASKLPPSSRAYWVPSSGTHHDWRHSEPYEPERIRALSVTADDIASKLAAESHRSYSKSWDDDAQDAPDSCACALQSLTTGERTFLDMHLPVKEEAPRGRRNTQIESKN